MQRFGLQPGEAKNQNACGGLRPVSYTNADNFDAN